MPLSLLSMICFALFFFFLHLTIFLCIHNNKTKDIHNYVKTHTYSEKKSLGHDVFVQVAFVISCLHAIDYFHNKYSKNKTTATKSKCTQTI